MQLSVEKVLVRFGSTDDPDENSSLCLSYLRSSDSSARYKLIPSAADESDAASFFDAWHCRTFVRVCALKICMCFHMYLSVYAHAGVYGWKDLNMHVLCTCCSSLLFSPCITWQRYSHQIALHGQTHVDLQQTLNWGYMVLSVQMAVNHMRALC